MIGPGGWIPPIISRKGESFEVDARDVAAECCHAPLQLHRNACIFDMHKYIFFLLPILRETLFIYFSLQFVHRTHLERAGRSRARPVGQHSQCTNSTCRVLACPSFDGDRLWRYLSVTTACHVRLRYGETLNISNS